MRNITVVSMDGMGRIYPGDISLCDMVQISIYINGTFEAANSTVYYDIF